MQQHYNNGTTVPSLLMARRDSTGRGRHLVATQAIERGRLLWIERPLAIVQSLDNRQYCTICTCCKCFVGDADYAMHHRFRRSLAGMDDAHVFPCRHGCGHVYCSDLCEATAWHAFHQYLCVGALSAEHPMVRFLRYVLQTNEILLLVAEWWVCRTKRPSDNPYDDFQSPLWWDVATLDLQSTPGGFAEAHQLQLSIRAMCDKAAALLSEAWQGTTIPAISAEQVARIVGACEQNAMGIRVRHPLCRDVFDVEFRTRHHDKIVQCLAQAGFIGNDDHNSNDDDATANQVDGELDKTKNLDQDTNGEIAHSVAVIDGENSAASIAEELSDEQWDYSTDEIAGFLANLFIDEDGSVWDTAQGQRQRDTTGDDFDYIFPPLDGTAMYATACKMNHSCEPNVIVLYPARTGYGQPLACHVVALRDVAAHEELTISYIDATMETSWEERQTALASYGFVCDCQRCKREKLAANESDRPMAFSTCAQHESDLFGSDSENENESNTAPSEDAGYTCESAAEVGEALLAKRLDRVDSAANQCNVGTTPVGLPAQVATFIMQHDGAIESNLQDDCMRDCWKGAIGAIQNRDYVLCRMMGSELEETTLQLLRTHGSWPHESYRATYWCAVLIYALACSHHRDFLPALAALDKAMALGLPRTDAALVGFVDYVERHANQHAHNVYPVASRGTKPHVISVDAVTPMLSGAICHPVEEAAPVLTAVDFRHCYVTKGTPVVMRNFATSWECCADWRDLTMLMARHGHRLVPIEHGSMMTRGDTRSMKEDLISLGSFIPRYMLSSLKKTWSLQEATTASASSVAYLAQHPLLQQIADLRQNVPIPDHCGPDGPSHVNVWLGTGGTRTPLHFDSYDNLFVQVAGAKYIRLYDRSQTAKLYVTKSGYGLQGNMSEVDCEQEDWLTHPLAKGAVFTEVVLLPGDALYIPAWTWHYVRSLTTSISINFWF